jgi:hypothetical protein
LHCGWGVESARKPLFDRGMEMLDRHGLMLLEVLEQASIRRPEKCADFHVQNVVQFFAPYSDFETSNARSQDNRAEAE